MVNLGSTFGSFVQRRIPGFTVRFVQRLTLPAMGAGAMFVLVHFHGPFSRPADAIFIDRPTMHLILWRVSVFIRFVACDPHREPDRPVGVFGAAYDILEFKAGPKYLVTEVAKTLDWFVTHLPIPDRFVRSRRPNRSDDGICWFKMDSVDCISNVRYLAYLVSECGIPVRELKTTTPGYVIYEDDAQIVAAPFATTPR